MRMRCMYDMVCGARSAGEGSSPTHRVRIAAVSYPMESTTQEPEVTPLELFFDLVFVFAITQVSSFVSDDATWTHLLEGVAILAVLWWAWVSYAWLGNTAASDDGAVRVVLLVAMGAMVIVSLGGPGCLGGER